jgi:hypothetical protein
MGATTSTATDPCGGASDEDDPNSHGSCCACACECEDHLKKVPGSDGTPGQRHMKAQTHEPGVTTKRTDTTGDGEERKCDLDTQSIIVGSLFLN